MAQHVSFFRGRALPGKRQAVIDQMNKWESDQKPKASGWVRTYLTAGNGDPDEFMGAVVWDNSENYAANTNRPEQDAWYREFRASLVADPEWFDGTLLREWHA